jgi:XTP/dITP diphosphohydrolase
MKKQIVFATGNKDKMREIREIMADVDVEVISMKEAGIVVDVEENGETFEENSLIKAKAIAEHTDAIVLADDSGLEIDYLNKEPGIYSARYAGVDTSYDIKNNLLLERLAGVPDEKRTARFVCAIAAAFPDGTTEVVRGTIEGIIGHEIIGENGFGYDPIFYLPQYGLTTAQIDPELKNELSHRGNALRAMRAIMEKKYEDTNR